MNWMQDMTARWVRILSAAGGGSTPLDEAVHQISEIGGTPGKKGRFSALKRNAAALAEASAVTVLSRQLLAGVVVTNLMPPRSPLRLVRSSPVPCAGHADRTGSRYRGDLGQSCGTR
jgi:hypothetical protein